MRQRQTPRRASRQRAFKSGIRKPFSHVSCEHDPGASLFSRAHAIQNEGTGASRTCRAHSSDMLDEKRLETEGFVTATITVTEHPVMGFNRRLQNMGRVPGGEFAITATATMALTPMREHLRAGKARLRACR